MHLHFHNLKLYLHSSLVLLKAYCHGDFLDTFPHQFTFQFSSIKSWTFISLSMSDIVFTFQFSSIKRGGKFMKKFKLTRFTFQFSSIKRPSLTSSSIEFTFTFQFSSIKSRRVRNQIPGQELLHSSLVLLKVGNSYILFH